MANGEKVTIPCYFLTFELFAEGGDGLAGDLNSLFERTLQASARGIQVSTAIKELLGHLIAGEVVDGAQTYPDNLVFLSIFAQGHREFQTFDLLGNVDEPFCIALDEVETFLVVFGDGVERSVVLRQIDQFLVHDETHQSETVFRIVVVNIPVDAVLVDAFGEQLGDDKENLRTCGGKGKAPGICHHAAIDGDGEMLALIVEQTELPYDAEY